MSTIPEKLEQRVEMLKADVALLKSQLNVVSDSASDKTKPWWSKIAGTFANNAAYDEAIKLGREYRESQHSNFVETAIISS
ncbi:MAG: hypothetical protein HC908_04645 [Calothrix sp. SM1_7_51]|nr:hypothetical protein [Calothrix sp. SM1_7_51]